MEAAAREARADLEGAGAGPASEAAKAEAFFFFFFFWGGGGGGVGGGGGGEREVVVSEEGAARARGFKTLALAGKSLGRLPSFFRR